MGIKAVIRHALQQHMKKNNPYIDNYPGERARAAAHRKDCPYCKAGEAIELWHAKRENEIVRLNGLCGHVQGHRVCKNHRPCPEHPR